MSISDLFRNLFLLSVITVLSYGNAMDLPMQQQNANNNISNITDVNFDKNDDKIKSTNINIINNEEANNNINYLFQSILDDLKTKNDNTTQVVLQKLEQVNSQLMNRTTMPTVEQGDLLQWVKHAREELQESEKSGYFHERTKYEKGLKKLNILKYNAPKYKKPQLQHFLNKKILETKRNRDELNADYYQEVADLKYEVLMKLENNENLLCTFNDISRDTIQKLLIHNSNNIVNGIGFDKNKKKRYNFKTKTHYNFEPINGIEQIQYYDDITKIVKATYNVQSNKITTDYKEHIYNLVKYGLIIPCLNNVINSISDEESDCISIFQPLHNDNNYLLTVIDNNTNNTLRLKLNIDENQINLDLDTLFHDDYRSIQLQNKKNYNYYNKNYAQQAFNKKK